MKQTLFCLLFALPVALFGQFRGNTTPDYDEIINVYKTLASKHKEIELYAMGDSDAGLPIYLCVLNGAGDSIQTFEKAQNSTTILINNAIHPGEPDGVNACLNGVFEWIRRGKITRGMPVIGIIPAYNVGGMLNRSGTSRANQDGPEEYGFRGNAQNLDLNRDFIKMDSKNMFTFAKIFHGLDPDVFLDTHVSNGADYQYTMTYIASMRERMAPPLADLVYGEMIPHLEKKSKESGYPLIPYVETKGETPESGITAFNDLPRYAMGYASMMNSISFTLETHMLKPFPKRVKATEIFIREAILWTAVNAEAIEKARTEARDWEKSLEHFTYNFHLTDKKDSILFKGYEFSKPLSELTGTERLKYHQDKPYEKYIPWYRTYIPRDTSHIPDFYVIGGQCTNVLERLKANNFELIELITDTTIQLGKRRIQFYETTKSPYEGHYLHSAIASELELAVIKFRKGDIIVPTAQKNKRFLVSLLEANSPDSYFAWNFFDSYLQQKEYFSPYVFEDKALELVEKKPALQVALDSMKETDQEFRESSWRQLYYIYTQSDYYEPTHNILPVFEGMYRQGE